MRLAATIFRRLRAVAVVTLVTGFLGATMVRFGPGFDIDERELDTRLSAETKDAVRAERMADRNIGAFYLHFLTGILAGDWGVSRSFNQPVGRLLADRIPLTLGSLGFGVAGGMSLGLVLAVGTLWWRNRWIGLLPATLCAVCISIPIAVLSLAFLWYGVNGRWAIALAVFPYVYRYSRNLLTASYSSPHVTAAMARGLSRWRVTWAHVALPVAPQLAALAGISVTLAFGAAIPVEVICDMPGIGQLAWQAALGRDLPLLVGITILVALVTTVSNGAAQLFLEPVK